MQNVEISKISLKCSKLSNNQKMQKNRLANIFDLLYNKNIIKNLNKKRASFGDETLHMNYP